MSLTYLGSVVVNRDSGIYRDIYAQYINTKTDAVHFINSEKSPVVENTFIKFNSSCEAFDAKGKRIGRFWGYPNFVFKFDDETKADIENLRSSDYIASERIVVKHILEKK